MELGVRDRAYAVFGGTRGIGFAAAQALAGDGASVALIGRDAARATDAARLLSEAGGRAIGVPGDLGVDGDAERVLASVQSEIGPIRGVAVTTGLGYRGQRGLLEATDDDWQHTFDDVFQATVRACRAAVPLLVDAGGGAIVTTAAYSVRAPKPHQVPYASAKAAVATMTKALAKSFGPQGVRANCVCPGATETEILAAMRVAFARDRGWPEEEALERAMVEDWGMHVALGRVGQPAEVGDVIAFLLSERASYVTGALVNIDGGTDFLTVAPDRGVTDAELADEVHAWLAEHWDPGLSVDEWWRIVGRAGWTAPHLPPEQGARGLSRRAPNLVRAAFAEFGALRPPGGLGLLMAAPTILTHGTPDQIERHVTPVVEGQANWCQLFSEPGSGSDLAGLTTRAERDGDRWVINGQKVWSSMARDSNYGMLIARTDFGVPKHAGISWFAFALDQPGVTIRPLREMTGEAVFNEVFLDDAVCDHADLIGGAGNGWAVTQTTLHFERTGIGAGGSMAGFPVPGPKGGMLGRRAGDAATDPVPGGNLVVGFADVVELARSQRRTTDPHIRQQLADLYTATKLGQWNARRAKAEAKKGGGQSIANLGKLAQTRIVKAAAQLGVDILGADAMLAAPDGVEDGRFSAAMVFSPASSIYGGTDEIQRNIVAERSLGLPRDDLPGKGRPYDEVLRTISRG